MRCGLDMKMFQNGPCFILCPLGQRHVPLWVWEMEVIWGPSCHALQISEEEKTQASAPLHLEHNRHLSKPLATTFYFFYFFIF